jgi:hypothetical protein
MTPESLAGGVIPSRLEEIEALDANGLSSQHSLLRFSIPGHL